MEKYNELFKTLVAAGLVMPNASGAYWFDPDVIYRWDNFWFKVLNSL